MTTAAVPRRWRPALTREDGRTLVGFRGMVLRSVVGEFTDVGVMLAQAADQGIDHLVLSPWIKLVPATAAEAESSEAVAVCQVQNEALSAMTVRYPGRLSALGAVPLADPEVAAAMLAALMRLPGMRGIEIPASADGAYLGDDRFTPLWAAAAQTGAVVFVHPTTRGLGISALDEYYLWNAVGNPLETTITAAHMAAAGVPERFVGLKILLAHGGGALLALRGRLRRAFGARPEARSRSAGGPDQALRGFYYDALTHDRQVLAALVDFAGAGHVVLGSDRPFDMGSTDVVREARELDLSAADQAAVLGGTARALLGLDRPASAPVAGSGDRSILLGKRRVSRRD